MAKCEDKIKEEYQKYLDPEEFREFKLKGLREEKDENNYDFYFKCLYDFFSTGKFFIYISRYYKFYHPTSFS